WRAQARVVAAYRDRYSITSTDPLGPEPESDAQKIDRARAGSALRALRQRPPAPSDVRVPREPLERHLGLSSVSFDAGSAMMCRWVPPPWITLSSASLYTSRGKASSDPAALMLARTGVNFRIGFETPS